MRRSAQMGSGIVALLLMGASVALADEGPPPAFEDAVAAARKAGKPLVIELFAVW